MNTCSTECFHYDNSNAPLIEVLNVPKSEEKEVSVNNNEIIFLVEGQLKYTFNDSPEYKVVKGEMLFFPAGGQYHYKAKTDVVLIILRLVKALKLCEAFSIEKLCNFKSYSNDFHLRTKNRFGVLNINPQIWQFLDGLKGRLADDLKCQGYFEVKIRELFYLFKKYYSKEELRDFFSFILSEDTVFSEHIRLRWQEFGSIGQMAESMYLSHKQFSKRFISIFGTTPQKWVMETKANIIYNEIVQTNKPFKQIAAENGLGSDTHFTWFCKKAFSQIPSEIRKNTKS